MKKKYIKPESTCIALACESLLLTASLPVNKDLDTPDNFSNKQGWSCADWSNCDEEQEE